MMLKAAKELLDQNGISNIIIESSTPKELKERLYSSFKYKKPLYNVIMYSPTITVGISIENNIRTHYHYDSGGSMDVLSSIQMMKRTRNAEVLKIYLGKNKRYLDTNIQRIQKDIISGAYKNIDDDGDEVGLTPAGIKLSKLIRINNTLENLHHYSFLRVLGYQFEVKGKVKVIKADDIKFLYKLIKDIKKKERTQELIEFDKYLDMRDQEVLEIECKLYGLNKKEMYVKKFEDIKQKTLEVLGMTVDEVGTEVINSYIGRCISSGDCEKNLERIMEYLSYGAKENFKLNIIYSNNDKRTLENKGISLKYLGYKKQRNRWYLSDELVYLYKELKWNIS
jgi:hypothetical protein